MFDSRNRGKAEYLKGSGSSVFCYLNYKKVKTKNMEHNLDCKTGITRVSMAFKSTTQQPLSEIFLYSYLEVGER